MGKYSKVIKKVSFEHEFADNGWINTYCKNCGWTENHDVHVKVDYKFCPGCGGTVKSDRFKYDVGFTRRTGLVKCKNCDASLGYCDGPSVFKMNYCPYCGDIFEPDRLKRFLDEIEL